MGAKELFQEWVKAAGIDETTAAAFANNEAFMKQFESGVQRQSDYSRKQDELAKQRKDLEDRTAQWTNWYQQAQNEYAATSTKLQKFQEKYGPIDEYVESNGQMINQQGDAISRTEYEKMLRAAIEQQQQWTLSVAKQINKAQRSHLKHFGSLDDFDEEEIEKFCVERGLPIEAGYEQMIAPKLAEKRDKEFEAKLEAERKRVAEETRKEVMSQHRLPVSPSPSEISPIAAYRAASSAPKQTSLAEIMADVQANTK